MSDKNKTIGNSQITRYLSIFGIKIMKKRFLPFLLFMGVAVSVLSYALPAQAGWRTYHGHKQSGSNTTSTSTTTLRSETHKSQQGHYLNTSDKWDNIHETIDTGLGEKIIETQIEASSESSGQMQETGVEHLDFVEHSQTHGFEHEFQGYSGVDY